MKKKASEEEFREFCKRQGYGWHKYADILKCPECFHTIWQSNRMPDFEITYKGLKTLVEVKQGSGKYSSWNFSDEEKGIRPIQREVLDEWQETQGVMPWLFLVLGEGRAPDGRGAFLIPWKDWKEIEKQLLDEGQRSIRFENGRKKNAVDILGKYQMEWVKGGDDTPSGWDLPESHPFFEYENMAELSYQLRKNLDLGKLLSVTLEMSHA